MNRVIKNILMILILILLCIGNGILLSPGNLKVETAKEPLSENASENINKEEQGNEKMQEFSDTESNDAIPDIINKPNYLRYGILLINCLVISMIIIYLIMSGFNKKTLENTLKDKKSIIIYISLSIVLTIIFYLLNSSIPKIVKISLVVPTDIN